MELGADENRDIVEAAARSRPGLGFLSDAPGFLSAIPDADDANLLAIAGVGPEALAQPARIVGDQPVGS